MTTALTPIKLSRAGADFNAGGSVPDGAGNTWPNTGKEFIAVMNGNGGSMTVTVHVTKTVDGAEDAKFPSGHIALQYGQGIVKFRKVDIKPL